MKKLLTWLVYSSENPENISRTIKSAGLILLAEVANILKDGGIIIPDSEISLIIIKAAALAGAFLTLVRFGQKCYNTFSGTKTVSFQVPANKLSPTISKKKVASKKK